ncbi:Dioxygenase fum3 [Myotisia sp. PD_48]|nr:Dioxygenase fum3 [Myotisia sp. PD_48]
MWRVPTDTPQVAESNGHKSLRGVTVDTPLDEVFQYWHDDGAIIIRGFLTTEQVEQMNQELAPVLDNVQRGSVVPHPALQAFHGRKTKRAGDVINHSATFRNHALENDFLHAICKRCYSEGGHVGDYWLSAATTLNAGGPQDGQILHRDLTSYPPYVQLGPDGTESQINFLIATTDFSESNGATRVIPGSHKWPFDQRGTVEQTIPAVMKAGDCLLISGKVVHGMGENKTTAERGCIQISVCASFLTPAEAHPFIVKKETARKLSRRTQRFLGFRSQYPRGSPGLWTKDYTELALHLELDDFRGVMEDLQEVAKDRPA